jgi:isopenicillin-N N-acyltransferase like protein
MPNVKEVVVSGRPFERGLQHGRALRREIAQVLDDLRGRIHRARRQAITATGLEREVNEHGRAIEREVPKIAEELRGLAAGAEISYADAIMLQARRELIGVAEHQAQGDCTLVAFRRRQDGPVISQTVDVDSALGAFLVLLRVLPHKSDEPEQLILSFAGLLGYLGINSHGLGIGINLVISPRWGPGVPPYLLGRHLMRQPTVDSCLSEIGLVQRSSSRSLTLADQRRLVTVEMTRHEQRATDGPDLVCHTNHYLHPELVAADRMNVLSRNNSRRRLAHIHDDLTGRHEEIGVGELFDAFVDHRMHPLGICAHAEGDPRRSETVCTVVSEPGKARLHVRPGLPCARADVQTFELRGARARQQGGARGAGSGATDDRHTGRRAPARNGDALP